MSQTSAHRASPPELPPTAAAGAHPAPHPSTTEAHPADPIAGLDEALLAQLPTFEMFFKTVGFRRVLGRVWGLLILAGQPLSAREIQDTLQLSQGSTSTCLNELAEWGAITSEFDHQRRCHLHSPVSNTLSIVATVFRRREQVVFGKFKRAAEQTLEYVRTRYGDRDPRVLSLRSIITTCDLADALMNLVFSSVERALGDGQSILARAVNAALRVGLSVPGKISGPRGLAEADALVPLPSAGAGSAPTAELADDAAELGDDTSELAEIEDDASEPIPRPDAAADATEPRRADASLRTGSFRTGARTDADASAGAGGDAPAGTGGEERRHG